MLRFASLPIAFLWAVSAQGAPPLDLPVDAGKLPAGASAAWLEVIKVAPAAEHWSEKWTRPEPRATVAAALTGALKALKSASEKEPLDVELLLATGITGRLAHNLDIAGAAEAGLKALKQAVSASPTDPRPVWQLGVNHCEIGDSEAAIQNLKAAEARWAGKSAPASYWQNVLECCSQASMPAHVLRAASMLRRSGSLSEWHGSVARRSGELLVRPKLDAELSAEDAYAVRTVAGARRLISAPGGISVAVTADQPLRASPVQNGTCLAQLQLGPFPGKAGNVFPGMVILAKVARDGESLEGFLDAQGWLKARRPTEPAVCPTGFCSGFEVDMPTAYEPEGGGLATIIALERSEPEFPSLLIEVPVKHPEAGAGSTRYFRPMPRPTRFGGRMFYVVVLDSARSVLGPARAEFQKILATMVIE